jgi:hypothetical protein
MVSLADIPRNHIFDRERFSFGFVFARATAFY